MNLSAWAISLFSIQGTGFSNWADTQPNNRGENEHCLQIGGDGQWWDVDCKQQFWFACRGGDAAGSEWRVTRQPGPWEQGARICRGEFGPDSRFAVPLNASDNDLLRSAMAERAPVWAALSDKEREATWVVRPTCNGGLCVVQNWANGEPDNADGAEHCVDFGPNGTWSDMRCSIRLPIACQHNTQRRWRVSTEKADWWSGHGLCSRAFGRQFRFAVPTTVEEHLDLKDVANGQAVWINYSDEAKEGLFNQDNCAQQSSCPLFRWEKGQPDNRWSKEHYAVMGLSGMWRDELLEDEHQAACRSQLDASEWRLTTQMVDWDAAMAQCQADFGNDFFFDVPRSPGDNDRLLRVVETDSIDGSVLLNIHDRNTENVWVSQFE